MKKNNNNLIKLLDAKISLYFLEAIVILGSDFSSYG